MGRSERDWSENLVDGDDAIRGILEATRTIAVLGIKPESRSKRAAFYVPRYMKRQGYEIVPVPVYYPEVTEILGTRVYRAVADTPDPVDMVNVFRKPGDIPPHVPDILEKEPEVVWFQLGIRNDEAAEALARAGIRVVQDRCLLAEHRRLLR